MLYSSGLFPNLTILLPFIICSDLHRNGCQFNMSTNVSSFLFSLVSQSGCKTKTFFCFSQEKFKKFWNFFFVSFSLFLLPISQGTFRVLRGANVTSVFHSHKLFTIFFWKFLFSLIIQTCQCFRERLSLLRVQKYHLYLHLQAFFKTIFDLFYKSLVRRFLQGKVFWFVLGLSLFLCGFALLCFILPRRH